MLEISAVDLFFMKVKDGTLKRISIAQGSKHSVVEMPCRILR